MTKARFLEIFSEEGFDQRYAEVMWATMPPHIMLETLGEDVLRASCRCLKAFKRIFAKKETLQ